jgi:hypothetical protein
MSVLPPTQEAEIRRIVVQSQPRQMIQEILCGEKTHITKKGLVEWLKCKEHLRSKHEALSSKSSAAKKKKKKRTACNCL